LRERFLVLDGLRGIAALAVFCTHLHSLPAGLAPQAGLAVDFFFLLSGFVLAHAYEERLGRPGAIWGFVRDRVIRLHPLLLLSLVPPAIYIAAMPGPHRDPLPPLTFLASAIPFPALWMQHFPAIGFPYNQPSWSLFWELIVNLAFALLSPRLSTRTLLIVTMALVAARLGALAWGVQPGPSDLTAALRAFPCFAMGVLLYRHHRAGTLRLPRWVGALAAPVLIATLIVPPPVAAALASTLILFLVHPLLIAGGAAREARFPRICALLGGMSYPLYILHVPLLFALSTILGPQKGAMAVIQPLLCVALVWLAWRLYDEPLRAWLRPRFGSQGHRQPDLQPDPAQSKPLE
jgi:peptidoglycan/LPS O-acetylase OafA/YrhL